jgi:outer membrane murein-binding lipoprotein Lpp
MTSEFQATGYDVNDSKLQVDTLMSKVNDLESQLEKKKQEESAALAKAAQAQK